MDNVLAFMIGCTR